MKVTDESGQDAARGHQEIQARRSPGATSALATSVPGPMVQRWAVEAVEGSPRMAAQRDWLGSLHDSPYMRVQREQIGSRFAGSASPGAGQAHSQAQEGVVQRYIKVKNQEESRAVFPWAMEYQKKRGMDVYTLAKLREALTKIDSSDDEKTDRFENEDELFDRVEELINATKDRSAQPVWRETDPMKVALELSHYLGDCVQLPHMELQRTYESNWDQKGGFGAEYETIDEKAQNWVIHVHRGPNGGLKSAKIKAWETRGVGHNGASFFKFDVLESIGIPEVDGSRKA